MFEKLGNSSVSAYEKPLSFKMNNLDKRMSRKIRRLEKRTFEFHSNKERLIVPKSFEGVYLSRSLDSKLTYIKQSRLIDRLNRESVNCLSFVDTDIKGIPFCAVTSIIIMIQASFFIECFYLWTCESRYTQARRYNPCISWLMAPRRGQCGHQQENALYPVRQ